VYCKQAATASCLGHLPLPLPRTWTNMGFLLFSATRSTTHWTISRRGLATVAEQRRRVPQTAIEKIVQKYAVGLPDGKLVKAGDYVMIRPEHVMTHDNTGPVISKFVGRFFFFRSSCNPSIPYNQLSWSCWSDGCRTGGRVTDRLTFCFL
jgi:hypothetical protein